MDARYTISKEFCGYRGKRFVARFCGEWIGQGRKKSDALMLCQYHADKRGAEISGAQTKPTEKRK